MTIPISVEEALAGAQAIIFDAGNTLMHIDYEFLSTVLNGFGREVAPDEIRRAEYAARAAIDRELAPDVVPPESIEGLLWGDGGGERPSYFAVALHKLGIAGEEAEPILAALRRHNEVRCLWRVVEPTTAAVLRQLKARGFRLAVVSNADGRVERDLHGVGLGKFFETIIDSKVVGVEKPDPRIFKIVLDRLGLEPGAAVYVGDVYGIDIIGARRAGLRAILIDRLHGYPDSIDCPRIAELDELVIS